MRLDGFASARAGYAGGVLVTKPLVLDGSYLELNVSTSAAGHVRAELRDSDGVPVPGRTLDDCPMVIGDDIARPMEWGDGSSIGDLSGRPVRLAFELKDADLFSFQCR